MRSCLGGLLLMSAIAPAPASADIYCGGDGPVLRLLTYRDGSVLMQTAWRGDFMKICNLTTSWKEVAPATCFAWMSKIAGRSRLASEPVFGTVGYRLKTVRQSLPMATRQPRFM